MTLTTASQITYRARYAREASRALASSQTRNFRFGFRRVWSLDPEFQRDACRRQRSFRYKYTDPTSAPPDGAKATIKSAIHSYWAVGSKARIHGGRYSDAETVRTSEDNPAGVRPGQNIEDAERSPMEHLLFGDKTTESTGYVIDPITNRKVPMSSYGGVDIPAKTFKSYRSQFAPPAEKLQAPIFYDGAPPEAELEKYDQVQIDAEPWDPASRHAPQEIVSQDKPAWGYRGVSWHRNDGIVSSSGSSIAFWNKEQLPDDLDKYKPVMNDEASSNAASAPPAEAYTDLEDYKAVRAHEPDGKYKPQVAKESARDYDDLDKYGAVKSHEPDGKYKPQAVADPSQEYDDLDKYTAIRAHEPDGKYKVLAVQDPTEEYEDLDKYTAVRAHEPDGKYKIQAVQDPTEEYSDLSKYEAVRAHEPDGKYKVRDVEDPTKEYDDLHTYQAFRAHEPDGKYKIEAVAVKPEELAHLEQDPCLNARQSETYKALVEEDPTKQYEDLDKYGPVRAHEPDGMYKVRDVQDPTKEYDDLHKYGAYRAHEPDGLYKIQAVADKTKEYDDLHKYTAFRSHEPDGKYAASYVEPKKPKELKEYGAFRSHEPDGKYAASHVKSKADDAELGSYKAYRSHEPDGKYAESYKKAQVDKAELREYKAFRSHEPDGKYAAQQWRPNVDQAELGTYKAYMSHEPDGRYAVEQQPAEKPEDLQAYGAFRSHEPDGKYASQASATPRAEPASRIPGGKANEPPKYEAVRNNEPDGTPLTERTENLFKPAKLETSQAVRNEQIPRPLDSTTPHLASELQMKTNYREMLETLMAHIAAESDAEDIEAAATVRRLKEKTRESDEGADSRRLTGSYARDFPEDFAGTWATDGSSKQTPLPTDLEGATQVDQQVQSENESVATTISAPLQPALDRLLRSSSALRLRSKQLLHYDPYSHEPQGLQTSYAEEIGCQSAWPALVKHYGSPNLARPKVKPERPTMEGKQGAEPEPTLYRILAYDPTMRTVEVAETSSVVPEQASPLSPAEVLVRLSNPTSFFPHFDGLQAEGFEIVSGSSDMLIFRKMRSAMAPRSRLASNDASASGPETIQPFGSVNPIDMTGCNPELPPVAAARYASPTGFVNYDLLPRSDPPRFVSGIDVRREEAVFSGGRQGGPKKSSRPSLSKRVIVGSVFLGGAMYSISVVGDYFKTGGTDGKGPKRL